jgi:hypothetical protein
MVEDCRGRSADLEMALVNAISASAVHDRTVWDDEPRIVDIATAGAASGVRVTGEVPLTKHSSEANLPVSTKETHYSVAGRLSGTRA